MKHIFLLLVLISQFALAQTAQDLKNLDLSSDQLPEGVLKAKTYIYQTRSFPLKNRFEMNLGGAQNVSNNGFLNSRQVSVGIGYHINEDWGLRLQYAKVDNKFNSSADKLLAFDGVLPDVDYAKSRLDLSAEYSLFYGKFRYSKDVVNYFDMLVGAGVADNEMRSGSKMGPVLSAGMAFWVQPMSYRIGIKDYIHQEANLGSTSTSNNVHGAVEVGYVF